MKLSWSSIQRFLTCQRSYELSYIENLQRKPGADKKNLLRGSAFHAGLEGALSAFYHNRANSADDLVKVAKSTARAYLEEARIEDKTIFNWDTRQDEFDEDYYRMLNELDILVPELLEYHIPLIGLGKRYVVQSRTLVLGTNSVGADPAIEWKFNYSLTDEDYLSGIVDTVLWDTVDQVHIMVDWKTRDGFPNDSMALLDGQLHLYAGVLNRMGANIQRVAMWQFLTTIPKPASISVKGIPNTGAASYATTWKRWVETLPYGIDPDDWKDIMLPKLKTDDEFQRVVFGEVTSMSSRLMFENVYATLASMKAAEATEKPFPAVLGSSACKWCDFAKLCANPFRYGGDVTEILERDYQPRSTSGSIEGVEDANPI